ncbi:ABC transporter ATP-binding protein [bacterium]|nr:ABC transporter ATP-binding protein [bacterium]
MPLVTIEQMSKEYPVGKGTFTALREITLSFEKAEFCGLVGPSGSGKTTLLNIIGLLDNPSSGRTVVLDRDTRQLSAQQAAAMRRQHMGFIFQSYNLLPVYTVFENVEFPLLLLGMTAEEREKRVWTALERMGIADKAQSRPAQLSGGEAQRVAVARAVVKSPSLVLADEPTANLDSDNSHNILEMMVALNRDLETTFLFATHDDKVIRYLHRKISLVDGRIARDEFVDTYKEQRP